MKEFVPAPPEKKVGTSCSEIILWGKVESECKRLRGPRKELGEVKLVYREALVGGPGPVLGGPGALGQAPAWLPYLFPAVAAPAPVRLLSALVSWGFWQGLGPGKTRARVPTCQIPPCSGLETCSALGALGVEEAEA